jgi:antirestriction protein|tara:strand:+ start:2392 stop:2676 length:285 start_codon:yes stop_codon:yes gene_type:complete
MNKQQKELTEENNWNEEAVQAYIDLGIGNDELENFEEAYQGEYSSNGEFVQELLEDTGTIPKDLPPYIHIDWERTASDIMMDYAESEGHYFRNI